MRPAWATMGRAERLWVGAGAAAFAALLAVYLAVPSPALQDRAYTLVTLPVLGAMTVACLMRARRGLAEERVAWRLLAAAGAAWTIGEAGWAWEAVVLGRELSYPHWTDAFYLANTPLSVAGVLALAWRRGTRHGLVQALDALLVAGALFIASWMAFLRGVVSGEAPGALGQAVTLAYPVGDVAIVAALVLALSRLDAARRRQLAPLLAGLALVAVADAAYATDVLHAGEYAPTLFDLGWGLGAAGIGWAALRRPVPTLVRPGAASVLEQHAATFALLPALVVACVVVVRDERMDLVSLVTGLVVGALVVVRQAVFSDNHVRLTRRLTEASRLAGLGMWSTDRSGRLDLDDGALRLAGLAGSAPGSVTLASFLDRLAGPGAPALLHELTGLGPGAAVERTVEPAADGKAGDRRALQLRATRHADGTLRGTLLDVTTEVRLEAQRAEVARLAEVARAKAAFLNTAAHELNTPLTPIRLSLANLRSGNAKGDPLALLERNVGRLTNLLHDVLEGARLQTDRLRVERHNMDLAALVREAVEEHQPAAQARDVRLEADTPAPVPVVGDPGRLHEVVMNLLSNALKFSRPGGHVRAKVAGAADGQAHVVVEDDGVGIAAKDLPLLFQPFTQVGAPHEGTGLGLYISRGVIEQHGGRIEAASPGEGLGARFEVTLPLAPVGALPAA